MKTESRRRTSSVPQGVATIVAFLAFPTVADAQRHRWHHHAFEYRRAIDVPTELGTQPEIVIAEFFTHGNWNADEHPQDAVVYSMDRGLVPSRVLQLGPGDFARVAFQPIAEQSRYYLYYGGEPDKAIQRPRWSTTSGLLLETRQWKECNLNSLESVRLAFDTSPRLGSDYVGGVFHDHNPCAPEPGPFLSRYLGILNAPVAGTYTFYTNSQDCSFLVIAGQEVTGAPGRHEPDTNIETGGTIELQAGAHTFEYYHAAAGEESFMMAAWALPRGEGPARISPNVFRYNEVLRASPTLLQHRDRGFVPDFRMAVLDDIPSSEVDQPAMVRVQFINASADILTKEATTSWSFGEGHASQIANPGQVFLRPGEYSVRLSVRRHGEESSITNRVYVSRQLMIDSKGQQGEDLESYMDSLKQYNSGKLSATGLVQLVRAYLAADDAVSATQSAAPVFFGPSEDSGHTDATRWALAKMAGPALRHRLEDSESAARLWAAASGRMEDRGLRAACAIEAADILLNDLMLAGEAKAKLDFAEKKVGLLKPEMASKYFRVSGDWQTRAGLASKARTSYIKASVRQERSWTDDERTVQRDAYENSIESFLKSNDLDRAQQELENWLRDFPRDRTEGRHSYLQMQCHTERGKYPHALAVAHDLFVINPRSSQADRILFLSAKCYEESKQIPQAIRTLQSFLVQHPNSPLVEPAKRYISRLMEAQRNQK